MRKHTSFPNVQRTIHYGYQNQCLQSLAFDLAVVQVYLLDLKQEQSFKDRPSSLAVNSTQTCSLLVPKRIPMSTTKTNAQLPCMSWPVTGKFKSMKTGGTAKRTTAPRKERVHSSDWPGRDLPSSITLQGTPTHLSRCHQTFFSRIPEIVLGVRSLDRGRLTARQGYCKPLAGTENCYYRILCEYEDAQRKMHAYSAEVS